ncbi:MAG: Trm112 family protein [Thermomicrobiales bacterium]
MGSDAAEQGSTESNDGVTGGEPLDPALLAILVCPVDKADLRLDGAELTCLQCGRTYPIEDGIPNMLVEDA